MCRWRTRAVLLAAVFSAGLWALAGSAAGAPPALRLDYQRPDSLANACPDASSFRNLVIARLGYDPFESHVAGGSHDEVHVALVQRGRRVEASALLVRGGRAMGSPRALEGSVLECESVVSALATT